jgi:hypothetical protein
MVSNISLKVEDTTSEFQKNMKMIKVGTIEATIKIMRSRMPFLKDEILAKIKFIFLA